MANGLNDDEMTLIAAAVSRSRMAVSIGARKKPAQTAAAERAIHLVATDIAATIAAADSQFDRAGFMAACGFAR